MQAGRAGLGSLFLSAFIARADELEPRAPLNPDESIGPIGG